MERYRYPFQYYELYPYTGLNLHNSDLWLLMILDFVSWIIGRGDSLIEAIQKASDSLVYQSIKDSSDRDNKDKLSSCITVLALEKNYNHRNASLQYYFQKDGPEVKYSVQEVGPRRDGIEAFIQEHNELEDINYFQVLLESVKKLQSYQLLK